jgi:ankyrin repeat protein
MNGHLPILQYLLSERGADVQARDADGWTALHNACSKVRDLAHSLSIWPHDQNAGIP